MILIFIQTIYVLWIVKVALGEAIKVFLETLRLLRKKHYAIFSTYLAQAARNAMLETLHVVV